MSVGLWGPRLTSGFCVFGAGRGSRGGNRRASGSEGRRAGLSSFSSSFSPFLLFSVVYFFVHLFTDLFVRLLVTEYLKISKDVIIITIVTVTI